MEAAVDRRPLKFSLSPSNAAWEQRIEWLVWAFVAVGAALRIGRYALRFPLWGDELMLASSFLDRDYLDFLRPLDCYMCSPLLFLWSELTVVKLGGFSEWTLRLVPLLSSLAALFLFRHVARRLVRGVPLLTAVAIFAVSYYPIRHASELRAYASDLTIALTFFALAVEWWRDPSRSRWLWASAAFAPIAVGFSYPAAFAGGAVSIGLCWHVWKYGSRGSKIAFAAYNLALVAGFLFFFKIVFAAQYAASGPTMTRDWADGFPPYTQPLKLVVWTASTFTGEIFGYPLGGDHGGSLFTFVGCVIGIEVLRRTGRGALAGIFGGLIGLALVAAALHRYPLNGEHPTQYLAGFICLFAGIGAGYTISAMKQAATQRRALIGATGALAAIACGLALHFAVRPYKHAEDEHHRGFARWFWKQAADGANVVCLYSDEGRDLGPGKHYDYLAFQRIYSPQHRRGTAATTTASSGRLRCVAFHKEAFPLDEAALDAWLDEMSNRHDLVGRTSYSIRLNGPRMPDDIGVYEVFEFVPKVNAAVEVAQRPR